DKIRFSSSHEKLNKDPNVIDNEVEKLISIFDDYYDHKFELSKKHASNFYYQSEYNERTNDILLLIDELFPLKSPITMKWLGVSSGHQAYLNIFSLIYKEVYRSQNDLIICIDEGDLYLHPKWQVDFFSKLVEVLPNLSKGSIQLILTSHSPLLLSDLPAQSVRLFSPNHIDQIIETKTFGANIYELYSELFLLDNQRTGSFSHQIISKLLSLVAQSNLTKRDLEKVKVLKSLIGDEVIVHALNMSLMEASPWRSND
ncbi:ATP-binding protein, partial [Vibrio alginolyticus]